MGMEAMLYGLYAGTFFCNVLFYMGMLQAVAGDSVAVANLGYMFLCSAGLLAYGFVHEKLGTRGGAFLGGSVALSGLGAVLLWLGTAPLALAMALFAVPYGYVTGQVAHLAARQVPVRRQGRFIGISLGLCNLALYFALYLP